MFHRDRHFALVGIMSRIVSYPYVFAETTFLLCEEFRRSFGVGGFFTIVLSLVLVILAFTSYRDASGAGDAAGSSPNAGGANGGCGITVIRLTSGNTFARVHRSFVRRVEALNCSRTRVVFSVGGTRNSRSTLGAVDRKLGGNSCSLVIPVIAPTAVSIMGRNLGAPIMFVSIAGPINSNVVADVRGPSGGTANASGVIPISRVFNLTGRLAPSIGGVNVLCYSNRSGTMGATTGTGSCLSRDNCTCRRMAIAGSSRMRSTTASLTTGYSTLCVPVSSAMRTTVRRMMRTTATGGVPMCNDSPMVIRGNTLTDIDMDGARLNRGTTSVTSGVLGNAPMSRIPTITLASCRCIVGDGATDALNVGAPANSGCRFVNTWFRSFEN